MDLELRRLITRLGQIGPQGFELLPDWQLQALVTYGIKELSQRERLPFLEAKKALDALARVCDICNKSESECDCSFTRCQYCGFGMCESCHHNTRLEDFLSDPKFPIPEELNLHLVNRFGHSLHVYDRCDSCQTNWLCFRCNIAHNREMWADWFQRRDAGFDQRYLSKYGPNWRERFTDRSIDDFTVVCPQCYEEPLWWVKS